MVFNYYDVTNVITTSQPVELDPDSNLYQEENVWKKYKRLSRKITAVNIGPGLLYIRTSHDGLYTSEEDAILEGESKDFDEIYLVKLRSPTANLRYRFTEYNVTTVSGQQFSGSRYKDRRDRNGVVVFQDDYESPTLKFVPTIVGIGTVARSIDVAYSGDYCLKTVVGANISDSSLITYFHPDFHEQKVGIQVNFSSNSGVYDIHLVLRFFDGNGVVYNADMFTVAGIWMPFKQLIVADEHGNNVSLVSGVPPDIIQIYDEIHSWNVMKLVIDLSTHRYVSAEINGKKINFSILLEHFAYNADRHITGEIYTYEPNAVIYLDNYIFTEDEI